MKPTSNCNKLPKSKIKRLIILTTMGVTLTALGIICIIIDPFLLIARHYMRVAPGYQMYELLRGEIAGAYVSAYLFNVTNAKEFLSGEDHQIKVHEVGPFTYQEKRLNKKFEIDKETEELHYEPYITATFLPEMSIGDPADINVTIANTALLAIASMVSTYPYWSQLAFNFLTSKFDSKSILTLPAKEYLWGYEEALLEFGNTIMPGWINFRKLGLMDRLYDNTRDYRIVLNIKEEAKFQIKRINGVAGMPYWGYDNPSKRTRCNTFEDAYEGFSYPPGLTPETPIRLFRNVFCRIVELDYVNNTVLDYGPESYLYKLSNRTYWMGADKSCLCSGFGCIDGLSDLSPCFYGLPVALSNAHFYGANPEVYKRIDGMRPVEEEHGSAFVIEPKLGSELVTKMTFQLNVPVPDVSFNKVARPFSNINVPIAYFKVVQPEPEDYVKRVFWLVYVVAPYALLALQFTLLSVGLGLLAISLRTYCYSCAIVNRQLTLPCHTPASSLGCDSPLINEKPIQAAL